MTAADAADVEQAMHRAVEVIDRNARAQCLEAGNGRRINPCRVRNRPVQRRDRSRFVDRFEGIDGQLVFGR